jgi:hypothetical protein
MVGQWRRLQSVPSYVDSQTLRCPWSSSLARRVSGDLWVPLGGHLSSLVVFVAPESPEICSATACLQWQGQLLLQLLLSSTVLGVVAKSDWIVSGSLRFPYSLFLKELETCGLKFWSKDFFLASCDASLSINPQNTDEFSWTVLVAFYGVMFLLSLGRLDFSFSSSGMSLLHSWPVYN